MGQHTHPTTVFPRTQGGVAETQAKHSPKVRALAEHLEEGHGPALGCGNGGEGDREMNGVGGEGGAVVVRRGLGGAAQCQHVRLGRATWAVKRTERMHQIKGTLLRMHCMGVTPSNTGVSGHAPLGWCLPQLVVATLKWL